MTTKHEGRVAPVSERELSERLAEGRRDDRRGDARVEARFDVEVSLTPEQLRATYTTNISRGGMMFSLTTPASLPGEIDVTLALPGGQKVTLRSEVRHVARSGTAGEYDVGVQFTGLDGASRRTIEEALSALNPAR
jgi:c-di-GMP-binding flagellar brake protein YcgR